MKNEVEVTHVTLNDEKSYDFHSNKIKKKNTWLQKSCSSHLYDYLIIYLHKRNTNNNL